MQIWQTCVPVVMCTRYCSAVITPPDGDMTDYLASLDLIRARDFATLWPTL